MQNLFLLIFQTLLPVFPFLAFILGVPIVEPDHIGNITVISDEEKFKESG